MNIVQEKNGHRPRAFDPGQRQRLREALVEAADATIERHGLGALRARDLAQATGCAVGTIYNLFADLDGLILEVNARTLARLDADLAGAAQGADPQERLARLALAYLDFAAANQTRWAALFEHRMTDPSQALPSSYAAALSHLFRYVEAPLGTLMPGGEEAARRLARSVFSAIHGIVALGLSEKLATIPPNTLRAEVETVARALARGLSGQQVGREPS